MSKGEIASGAPSHAGAKVPPSLGLQEQDWLNNFISTKVGHMGGKTDSTIKISGGDTEDSEEGLRHDEGTADFQKQSSLILKLFGTQTQADEEEEYEQTNALWMNKYVVHPESPLRRNWDMFAILLVVYTVFVLPTRTAFFWQKWEDDPDASRKWDGWVVMDVFIDTFFMTDVVFNFFTGYYESTDEDVVIMHGPDIAWRYIKGWLILDVLASIPLDVIVLGGNRTLMKLPRLLKILRLSRLLRLLRLSRMLRYLKRMKIFEYLQISPFQIRIIKLVATEITFLHWSACIQWLVVAVDQFPEDSWATRQDLVGHDISEQYSWAFFRALSHMLCIGYGQEPPYNTVDAWTCNISMLLGASLFAVFVGIITSLLIQLDSGSAVYAHKLDMVNQYMAHRHLPLELRQRIRDSYEFRWKNQKAFDEQNILYELPVSLRTEVAIHNCRDLLEMVPFFVDCEKGLIASIVTLMVPSVFLEDEIIIREGETSKAMFFIRYGEIQVSTDDQVITYLTAGSYFGEIGLVKNIHRTADVTTTKDCELYSLLKNDFHDVFDSFPEAMAAMTKIADHRMTSLEWYKRQLEEKQPKEEGGGMVGTKSVLEKMNEMEVMRRRKEKFERMEKTNSYSSSSIAERSRLMRVHSSPTKRPAGPVTVPATDKGPVRGWSKLNSLFTAGRLRTSIPTIEGEEADQEKGQAEADHHRIQRAASAGNGSRRRLSVGEEQKHRRRSSQFGALYPPATQRRSAEHPHNAHQHPHGGPGHPNVFIEDKGDKQVKHARPSRGSNNGHNTRRRGSILSMMAQAPQPPESPQPTVREATAFELMMETSGRESLESLGIQKTNIDMSGAKSRWAKLRQSIDRGEHSPNSPDGAQDSSDSKASPPPEAAPGGLAAAAKAPGKEVSPGARSFLQAVLALKKEESAAPAGGGAGGDEEPGPASDPAADGDDAVAQKAREDPMQKVVNNALFESLPEGDEQGWTRALPLEDDEARSPNNNAASSAPGGPSDQSDPSDQPAVGAKPGGGSAWGALRKLTVPAPAVEPKVVRKSKLFEVTDSGSNSPVSPVVLDDQSEDSEPAPDKRLKQKVLSRSYEPDDV
uniref:Cyclic nucleotide-binding domain-containing protein n=1 Tax=Pyramimonas obovata TaxID=1411642 RepID=A0A7S0RFV4_9CHLO|mmetsp:Transcript_32980/g.71894  ORF Transcript_32980/g.71894 Transcript_32980/m.71894 type:complete len:1088 (+) Transcript_32980:173-3436(+)|eukprot:CAMPEP_0118926090 /NCGR_PEP_ID=MMETSP1169-20130426/3864_1 /TAXON_ID=36882 /ORGANISM="Pyramimonas obovata, Strain CCMP722" /LENGTH=1087 /DNA_ID=CAMNT_0006867571 /DNA_START=98 /DNA_END=3361 /DNA_ORIENTATION=+